MSEIQNPQNQPGMDKSVILVFAVSMILLVLAQQFLTKPQPKSDSKPEQKQTQSATSTPGTTGVASASPAAAPVIPASLPVSAVAATAESDTVVENDLYRITFTNRGAQVKSWILKKYKDNHGRPGLELVHQQAAGQYGYPLSLWSYDAALREKLN